MYLIVGIDPGTTVGIGILNFKGEVINFFSSKNMSVNNVVEYLNKYGNPAIIASDVDHISNFIYKIASAYNAKIFIPEKNLSVNEKIFLTRNIKYHDNHQRDALSAAIYAYKNYKNIFNKIEKLGYGDDVKFYVVKGYSLSEAIAKVEPEAEIQEKIEEKKPIENVEIKEFLELKEQVRILKKSRQILKKQIIEKEKEIERLKEIIKDMERERKILQDAKSLKTKDVIIKTLEISLEALKNDIKNMEEKLNKFYEIFEKIGKKEIVLVGVYPEIFDGLTYIEKNKKIDKNLLSDVEIVFTEKNLDLPCIVADAKYLKNIDDRIFYIEKEEIEKIRRSYDIENIIEEYKKSRRK
ncbi:MAG: DUF460 domain-containing protein [Candidatus Altarchaeaceae archaeon]